jgi:hypothetical protein
MTKQISAQEVHAMLHDTLQRRPDLGLRKAVADEVLDPANPFEPQVRRRPRRWFILFCILAALITGCLMYFNAVASEQEQENPAQRHRFDLEAGH